MSDHHSKEAPAGKEVEMADTESHKGAEDGARKERKAKLISYAKQVRKVGEGRPVFVSQTRRREGERPRSCWQWG